MTSSILFHVFTLKKKRSNRRVDESKQEEEKLKWRGVVKNQERLSQGSDSEQLGTATTLLTTLSFTV